MSIQSKLQQTLTDSFRYKCTKLRVINVEKRGQKFKISELGPPPGDRY